ncbi:hypothetical protein [Bradyrhizobium sp. USDA 10063]
MNKNKEYRKGWPQGFLTDRNASGLRASNNPNFWCREIEATVSWSLGNWMGAMSVKDSDTRSCDSCNLIIERRALLLCGLALTLPSLDTLPARADAAAARAVRPQPGDHLVFMSGERREQIIGPADLTVGAPPTLAFPMDPVSHSVRDASRVKYDRPCSR